MSVPLVIDVNGDLRSIYAWRHGMKYIYTIRDNVAEECGPVFDAVNDEVAKRSFKRVLEKAIDVNDYSLIRLAKFDPRSLMVYEDLKEFDARDFVHPDEDLQEKMPLINVGGDTNG